MPKSSLKALIAIAIGAVLMGAPASAQQLGRHQVFGVEDGDMLKMRKGPGTGYRTVLGLPNGTVLRVKSCQQTGSTRWCKVALNDARAMVGYVSWAYLRKY
ncbi:SH3 domain-containing protein [Sulfitobacter marinus]|uniref:SH3 domain-containing protein n=1 Tax=Sulfitobacter marinus TaxID=394264 RepID=A0A1I6UIW4_9RHOB|nr:SH3 domain-containing protein [Sulfitobacter marinus]SFT01351.1 SH3 domain-containing protein [Sulfitobacter marinus]